MELLKTVWGYVLPIGGGLTIGAIIVSIAIIILKSTATKMLSKIDIVDIENKAVQKGVEKVKEISFKQSIQPLVESELKKITEQANIYIADKLDKVDEDYLKIVLILEKLSVYFDDSIAVSNKAKEDLKSTIATAKKNTPTEQEVVVAKSELKEIKEDTTPTKKETVKNIYTER